ncbi:MAG: gliding motility protein GldM [Bacteroidales bacterium]|jgi:gliding motility-associated protein GldM|nr:gliding motility protein GldM [Bacteroidales bacterium]
MGAKNCPETPRQRLISMMYLVLTAMLALNVSKDILNAFSIVDETLHTSNLITESKNKQDYNELNRQKVILGEDKVAKEFEKAMQIKELSNNIIQYIEDVKVRLIEFVDGQTAFNEDGSIKTVAQIKAKDNISKTTQFMINESNAEKLKKEIEKYRNKLLSFVDEKDRENMQKTISLDVNAKFKNANGAPESWESHYFENVIFAAGVTLLNKTIGEVRNSESVVLKYTLSSITKDDFKFSNVQAKVIPKSQIVFRGDPYEAEIIVAAYDSKQPIEAFYRSGTGILTSKQGAQSVRGNEGVAPIRFATNQVGDFNYTGFVEIVGPDGLPKTYPFTDRYIVMEPSATVAADKMNALYAGIDNPVSVSASVSAEKVDISLSAGSKTKTGPGKYNINVPTSMEGKMVTVSILAEDGGKQKIMGTNEFRVKRIPDPVAVLGGDFKGKKISKAELLANPFIKADMGFDFIYDLKWVVNSYQVTFNVKGIEEAPIMCNNRQFSDAIKNKINASSPGTVIWFEDIKVSCVGIPGTRTLNTITVQLK